ncbi:Serine acetyltransferase [Rhodovulum sp. PH10]|uniref:serine O-acetyltransferase n=1 Tax=Rhodovulum sp. PH10 TaxID=1187851 RepID=UPI00027C1E89|nr:serine O-acetyltransferase [Rhodovulum sp. PH10]EJW10414.1 Serine acetyltransferase [Rhodovulum sp. PH10]
MSIAASAGIVTLPSTRQYDRIWNRLSEEAQRLLDASPEFGALVVATVLNADGFEDAVARRISARLAGPDLAAPLIHDAFRRAYAADPAIGRAMRADALAVLDRDPATERLLEPVLYYKGFHAIQTQRLAHWAWGQGRRDLALFLQSRSSEVFQTDIHPAVPIGAGVFLDHATGLVVGETAVIEDDVSILQAVTLGGTGKEGADRHPKIRRGVLIGAGAKILGNIEVGSCARVAAGSVVLKPVPPDTTVAGVPAREVGKVTGREPARTMDQILGEDAYASFVYVI